MNRKIIGIAASILVFIVAVLCIFSYKKSQEPIDIAYQVSSGDTLGSIFEKERIPTTELNQLIYQPLVFNRLKALQDHEEINLLLTSERKLKKLTLALDKQTTLTVEDINNQYQPVIIQGAYNTKTVTVSGVINKSLYQSLRQLGLSQKLTMKFIAIFSQDLNLTRKVHRGDVFSLTYAATFKENKLVKTQLLVASITIKDHKYWAILNGTRYYTKNGQNWAKAFERTPVHYTHISSPFSPRRYHPILHRYRAHEGVDLAAKTGTPVHASSNGKIIFAGKKVGYGNVIILKYDAHYSSRYAHLKKFAKGIKVGKYVKKGQVIGYVGMTGLATGPHLHYEFRINKKPVNPLKARLPQAPGLYGKQKKTFERYVAHLQ